MSAIITSSRPTTHYQPHYAPKGFGGTLSWLLWKGPVSNYLLKAGIWLFFCTMLGLIIGIAITPEKAAPPPAPAKPIAQVNVQKCQDAIKQQLSTQKIHFQSGSSQLQKDSLPLLKELAHSIKKCPEAQIRIEGYTDNRGSELINESLSLSRAERVSTTFKKYGISAKQLSTVGYGENSPIADNTTTTGRAENRRIEIILQ